MGGCLESDLKVMVVELPDSTVETRREFKQGPRARLGGRKALMSSARVDVRGWEAWKHAWVGMETRKFTCRQVNQHTLAQLFLVLTHTLLRCF